MKLRTVQIVKGVVDESWMMTKWGSSRAGRLSSGLAERESTDHGQVTLI